MKGLDLAILWGFVLTVIVIVLFVVVGTAAMEKQSRIAKWDRLRSCNDFIELHGFSSMPLDIQKECQNLMQWAEESWNSEKEKRALELLE